MSSRNQHRETCEDLTIGVAAGKKQAKQWVRQLRTAIFKQLSLMPKGFPLAPEDAEFAQEIRQMVVARYRVLFTIRKHKVHVLHVRGAHVGGNQ